MNTYCIPLILVSVILFSIIFLRRNNNLLYNIKLNIIKYRTKTNNISYDNNNFIKPEIICDKCKRYEHY